MPSIKQLEQQLADLQVQAHDVDEKLKSTREALYLMLVDTYIFYLEASKQKGWYERKIQEIKDSGGKVKRIDSPHIPFLHLLRLIHKEIYMRNADAKLGKWARALSAIQLIHKQRPYMFKNNLRGEMFDYLKIKSVNGVIAEIDETIEETGGEPTSKTKSSTNKRTIADNEKAVQGAILAKQRAANSAKSLGKIKLDNVFVGTPEKTNLAVLVGRVNEDGSIDIVGTCDDEKIVESATFSSVNTNEIQQHGLFGVLAHALEIHSLPRKLHYRNARTNFFRLLQEKHSDGNKAYETVRVALLKNGEIVLSKAKAHNNASLTTIAVPKAKHTFEDNYFLRGSDRYWIETKLLLEGQIAVWSSNDNELQDAGDKIKADKLITLKQKFETTNGKVKERQRNVYFYNLSALEHDNNTQPYVIESDFDANISWRLELSEETVRTIYYKHFAKWMNYINKRAHIPKNSMMSIIVTGKAIELLSQWDTNDERFTNTSDIGDDGIVLLSGNDKLTDIVEVPNTLEDYDEVSLAFMRAEQKRIDSSKDVNDDEVYIRSFTFKPHDMYQLFEALATNYSGAVLEYATNRQLRVTHSDSVAEYKTYIPACDTHSRNRVKKGFVKLCDVEV